jgi:hypothetical protein
LFIQFSGGEYEPLDESYTNDMGIQLTHWMYEPSTGELEALQQDSPSNQLRRLMERIRPDVEVAGWVYRELEVILKGWEGK